MPDAVLRQKITEEDDPQGFRNLVMEAAGIRPEAQDLISHDPQ